MITYENSINKIRVEAYTLYEFIQETGEVQATGATLCLDNDFFCQNMGGNYLAYFDMSEAQDDGVPELQEDALAEIANADIGDKDDLTSVDNTPSDVNTAATPPTVEDGAPSTPEQTENVNRRRGRPPRN